MTIPLFCFNVASLPCIVHSVLYWATWYVEMQEGLILSSGSRNVILRKHPWTWVTVLETVFSRCLSPRLHDARINKKRYEALGSAVMPVWETMAPIGDVQSIACFGCFSELFWRGNNILVCPWAGLQTYTLTLCWVRDTTGMTSILWILVSSGNWNGM